MEHDDAAPKPYRILVAVGEPDQLEVLLAIAVPLARARHGQVTLLHVRDGDARPSWLKVSPELRDVISEPSIVSSRNVSQAILAFARRLRPDLLLLHWKSQPRLGRYLVGRTLDPVIQNAPCDVAVARVGKAPGAFAERMGSLRRILVPSGGGPNALLALSLALDLGPEAVVTALRVARRGLGPAAVSAQRDILQANLEPWENEERLRRQVAVASGVVEGIEQVAAQEYDLVLVGATRESFVDRLLFGNLPQQLASGTSLPLIIVRRHDPTAAAALRRVRWWLIRALPQLTLVERTRIYREVRRDSRTSMDFYVMTCLAAAIASLGLLLNSPAAIIGAMLVAPMMSALVGIALGIVQGDSSLLRLGMRTTLLGALLAIGIGGLVGLFVPQGSATTEMLSRSKPTLLDLAVALASGAAAAYATARQRAARALSGVAIAVALVPPLATAGLAAASGRGDVSLGALLLFVTNLIAIVSANALVMLWMGFHPNIAEARHARTFRGGLLSTIVLLLFVAAILGTVTVTSVRRMVLRNSVERALHEQDAAMRPDIALVDWEIAEGPGGTVQLELLAQATRGVSPEEVTALQDTLSLRLRRPVLLSLTVMPVERFSPSIEPGESSIPAS